MWCRARTLMGGRAERVEYLLLHRFHDRRFAADPHKYLLPDKRTAATRRRAATAVGDGAEDAPRKRRMRSGKASRGGDDASPDENEGLRPTGRQGDEDDAEA